METAVECTHCKVVMTSWVPAGSRIRYFRCPFCERTHSSLYGEVFRRRAGARVVRAAAPDAGEVPQAASPAQQIPMASPDDVRWARVKASAARWFARLDAEGKPSGAAAPAAKSAGATCAVGAGGRGR
jgi:hypothetical protein